jgi:hypothetical protein
MHPRCGVGESSVGDLSIYGVERENAGGQWNYLRVSVSLNLFGVGFDLLYMILRLGNAALK